MYRSLKQVAALSAALAILVFPTAAHAQQVDPRPICTEHIGTAYVSHYGGPRAEAACAAAEQLTSGILAYRRFAPQQAALTCYVLSTRDVASAYLDGHAIAVYDNSLAGQGEAQTICDLALARGEVVLDADENPYTP